LEVRVGRLCEPAVWGRRDDGRRLAGSGGYGWWHAAGSPEPAGLEGGSRTPEVVAMTNLDTFSGGSRPSKDKCPEESEQGEKPNSADIQTHEMSGGTAHRPVSVDGAGLREEGVLLEHSDGWSVPASSSNELDPADPEITPLARSWYNTLREWREWYKGYENKHITFERERDGKTVRTKLENAYQPEYADKYYAKLKGLEREISREYSNLTTVMLTFSASTLNENGVPRCPADHMREIQEGWNQARKELYRALSGFDWEYARVWEPTSETGKGPAGYGHLHVGIFVDTSNEEITAINSGKFADTMEKYTENVKAAHPAAHRPESDKAVSVNHSVNNLGSYISEYIGSYGERAVDRPVYEQQFYSVVWATGTRRVSFSEGATELINADKERQERREKTGTRPEDRGDSEGAESGAR
jgi:hypothetical protein